MSPAADPSPSPPNLLGMTKAQLLAYAEETGVGGVSSRNTKAEIRAAIEEAGS